MRILHLTLKKQWFDMIASGSKSEEYREIKPYWTKRLNKTYDAIEFRNGYSATAPRLTIELKEILTGLGIEKWGAPLGQKVFILKLGKIITGENMDTTKKYYCLGNGARKCDGCGQEKNWTELNELPDEERKSIQETMQRVDDTECILRGRPWFTSAA